MSALPGPEATSIRVAEYLTELPPREVRNVYFSLGVYDERH